MEFGEDNFLQSLERPPNINNLSIKNIIQIALMLILGCWSGYNLYKQFSPFKLSLWFVFQLIIYAAIFGGMVFGFYGMVTEKNPNMKSGFLCFWFGCVLLIIKAIIDFLYDGFYSKPLFELLIALALAFVIMKQIQHI